MALEIFPLNCWATPLSTNDSTPRENLVINGCGVQQFDFKKMGSGGFCFDAFRFPDPPLAQHYHHQHHVYIHCQLVVCEKNSTDSLCSEKAAACSGSTGRRKRAVSSGSYLSLQEVTVGPIAMNDARPKSFAALLQQIVGLKSRMKQFMNYLSKLKA
jgi:hypothetical protein